MLLTILSLVVVAVSCAYVYGVPYFFCTYRTETVDEIKKMPPDDDLISFFQENGWQLAFEDYKKLPRSLPHQENIFEATAVYNDIISNPEVTLYIAVINPDYEEGTTIEGLLQIFIEDGNRLVNRSIYDRIIDDLNRQFDLSIPGDQYNYDSYCGT